MRKPPIRLHAPVMSVFLLGAVFAATAFASRPADWPGGGLLQESERARVEVDPALLGHSGKLRAMVGYRGEALFGIEVHGAIEDLRWKRANGEDELAAATHGSTLLSPPHAGAWVLEEKSPGPTSRPGLLASLGRIPHAPKTPDIFLPVEGMPTILSLRPAEEKREGELKGYRIGNYPPRPARYGPNYEPPRGYIEVDEATSRLNISEGFTLGEFLTKDQHEKWPKFLVLDLRLIDKLELIIEEMRDMGHAASSLFIMSGYRTPNYNGDGSGGRARYSRHIYGDAADIWLDESGDGRMDDLNGDGRSDKEDGRVLAQAAAKVQDRYPDYTGGIGVYGSRGARGPFVHVDLRGNKARW